MTTEAPSWLNLHPGERLLRSAAANRTAGGIAAGGRLVLTSQRLVHHTHGLEKSLTSTPDWEFPLADLVTVDVAPRGRNPFDGSMRPRLRVRGRRGEAMFVVNRAPDWVSAMSDAAAGRL